MRAIATGYEIQVALVKGISLHEHKIDHVAHLGPSAAAGIGTLLNLPVETIYQAVQQALHVTTATRQSRKGEISSWKAFAPAHAGKLAIEAVDRAMRGEGAPSPIYEGEDGVIAWMLGGWDARYHVPLPAKGEAKRQILDTYTKQHSAEYQSQAPIDLARKLGREIAEKTGGNWDRVKDILFKTSASHPLRDRHRRQRSAEDGPEGQPRNARPFHHVHPRGRVAGPGVAPCPFVRARARAAARHRAAVAQDPYRRGQALDRALPLARSIEAGVRRRAHRHARRRHGDPATRSRWPMRTRTAHTRSGVRNTSRSSAHWPKT